MSNLAFIHVKIFSEKASSWLFFCFPYELQNSFISYEVLLKLGIPQPLPYLQVSFCHVSREHFKHEWREAYADFPNGWMVLSNQIVGMPLISPDILKAYL